MKIALPSRENQIDSHFGHCDHFTVFTVNDDRQITNEEVIASPQGCGCKSNIAQILAEKGVKLMLAGNMGNGAVNVLKASGIEVVRGCSGHIKEVAEAWISGNVRDSGESCSDHGHECSH